MSKRTFFLVVLVGVILFWWFIQQSYNRVPDWVGKKAPDFTLEDEAGKSVSLSDFSGKVVLVHFWASWCPPCLEEFPALNRFYKKFLSEDFVLLAVTVDEKGSSDYENFKEKVSFDFPVLFDHHQHISHTYGTHMFPEGYLIDRNGIVVKKIIGPQNWDEVRWEREILGLVAHD